MRTKLLASIFVLTLMAAPAEALSTASAFVTVDWTGFAFTTTGSLSVSIAQSVDPHESGGGFTQITPITDFDTASDSGSSVNGFLSAVASTATLQPGAGGRTVSGLSDWTFLVSKTQRGTYSSIHTAWARRCSQQHRWLR